MSIMQNIVNETSDVENVLSLKQQTNSITPQKETEIRNVHTPLNALPDTTNLILIEHCYARPHNWKSESNFLRPTKTLFILQKQTKRKSTNPLAPVQYCDDVIDIEAIPPEPSIIYDEIKAKQQMEECEKYASCARVEEGNENWEESISKLNWSPVQTKLFNGMVNILNSDHLARLAYSEMHNEPILRRTIIDKSEKRVRHLMASILWDPKLTQWLHHVLIDHLSTSYLASYLDILQTLKSKLPTFIDKMMYGPNSSSRVGILSNESLFPLLKRPWDPVASSLNLDKPKKLPGNPIIVIVPSTPFSSNSSQYRRLHKWTSLLTNLASVHVVHIGTTNRISMINCVDQLLAATRSKIQELKSQLPGRPIVLAGFNAGSALALQVAQVETILCVLCLGFSLHTAEGKRGDLDDNLLELQCPVLFVIGQCSNTSLQEEMEDLRERMRVETGLIVVGSADDYLRVNKKKKRAEGITQGVVDRCIVDEIGEFVSGILLSPYPPQIRQSPAHVPPEILKRPKADRKRNSSNGSSLDSEPPSPTPRITRPVGRPPGSKSKTKLEAKWANQVAQGTLPNPPNSNPPLTHIPHPEPPLSENKPLPKFPLVFDFNKKISSKIFTHSNEKNNSKQLATTSTVTTQAKMQAMGLTNRTVVSSNTTLSSLLQGGIRTAQPKSSTGIKVLENITLNTNSTAKLVSSTGRTIDLSKITVLNSVNTSKPGSNYGNVVFMADGKVKSGGVTRYITSKKQLMGNKPPKPIQKFPYIPTSSGLPPPANLTSQDIMDLPIIFADDNQMLTSSIQPSENSQIIDNQQIKATPGKFVFINKQLPIHATTTTNIQTVKRSAAIPGSIALKQNKNSVKYAKIILSKRVANEESTNSIKVANLPADISVKKIDSAPFENIDLETELVATAVPKPNYGSKDVKNVTVIYKKPQDVEGKTLETLNKPTQTVLNNQLAKRSANQAELLSDDENLKKCAKLES